MRSSRPVTVTLGKQQSILDASLASGNYESASEVVRAALRALRRQDDILNEVMSEKIRESLQDSRPDIPMNEVFAKLPARQLAKSQ